MFNKIIKKRNKNISYFWKNNKGQTYVFLQKLLDQRPHVSWKLVTLLSQVTSKVYFAFIARTSVLVPLLSSLRLIWNYLQYFILFRKYFEVKASLSSILYGDSRTMCDFALWQLDLDDICSRGSGIICK